MLNVIIFVTYVLSFISANDIYLNRELNAHAFFSITSSSYTPLAAEIVYCPLFQIYYTVHRLTKIRYRAYFVSKSQHLNILLNQTSLCVRHLLFSSITFCLI